MHDDPDEGEGEEEDVQEGASQGVRPGGLQEVLQHWNQEIGMWLQVKEGLSEERGGGL